MHTEIQAKRVFFTLISINALLVAIHLILHGIEFSGANSEALLELVRLFSLDQEGNVPTWFAQTLLASIAGLFGVIALRRKDAGESRTWPWFFLSIVFVYLSIDEGAQIHELTIEPFQNLLGIESGFLFFAWIVPMGLAILVATILLLSFFIRLDKALRNQLFLAAFVFLLGAIGMEMISGAYWESVDFVYDMRYRVYNAIEEGLENTGSILAIVALYTHVKNLTRTN